MHFRSLIAFAFLVPAALASAQARSTQASAPLSYEIFGGFSTAAGNPNTGIGFNGGVGFTLSPRTYFLADVSYLHDDTGPSNNTSEILTLVGAGYRHQLHRANGTAVFGDLLVGADTFRNSGQAYTYRFNNATSLALCPEGGLEYMLSRRLGVRATGGYLYSNLTNSTYGGPVSPGHASSNRFRLAFDLVYRF